MTSAAEQLRIGLNRIARAWWRVQWLRRLARVAAGAAAALLAWAALDWLRPLSRIGLLSAGGAALLLAVAGVAWLAWQWRRWPSAERAARLVEERCPDLEAPVRTALDADSTDSALSGLVIADAAAAIERLDTTRVVDADDRRRGLIVSGAALAFLLVAGTVSAPVVTRAARTWQFTVSPPRVVLQVTPGDRRVVRGDPLRIEARLVGVPDGVPYAAPRLVVTDREASADGALVAATDGSYAIDLPSVTRDFTYRVEAGPLVSSTYQVDALDRPAVARVDVAYVYPAFSGLKPREELDAGDIYAPAGTKVTVTVQSTKPLQAATLVPTTGQVTKESLPLQIQGEMAGTVEFEVREDGAYRIALVDRDALDSQGDTEYFVRVMDDRPPDVRILRPAGDRGATRLEEVTIEARAEDDYGIQRLDLVYAVRGGDEKVIPLGGTGATTTVTGRHTIYLEDLDVVPGDFVTYYARARDVGRGKRSSEARSDIFFLEVRPTAQEFLAAQSSGGMNMAGGDADDLIAAQKDVVVATWKLERRATGGRSPTDIRAVADAQAAVQEKTQAQAARGAVGAGQRRRGQPEPEAAPAPLLAAAEAMTRATEQLRALRTGEAIPHEMEALNQLLRAQAEIRRRQIARQQGGGGGGRGRSGNEDLSALFDRELLRQQGSQYEQRSNVESRADTQENPALDRIRELARRQDDLAREQQALARDQAQLPAEEIKRRLERLTREQERLREQAQQLAQQLQQGQQAASARPDGSPPDQSSQSQAEGQPSAGQPSQGSPSPSGGQGQAGSAAASGQRMAEAAREMQAAATDLQNQSPDEAAARGAQSLQALRDAERALQGALPDERRRAAGDVQLEAQALADAQRRLAEGVDRMGAGAGAAEQRRRLAGEQGRVADRVGQLERQLRELARTAAGGNDPLAQASAELARRRLAEQLKQAAQRLQGEPAAAVSPEVGRQQREAAGVLDRVASLAAQATGRGDRGTAALSEQLANARDVRDRLRDLESRIEALARQVNEQAGSSPGAAAGQNGAQDGSSPGKGSAGKQGTGKQADGQQGEGGKGRGGQSPGEGAGQAPGQGQGQGGGDGRPQDARAELQRLQQEYQRELRSAQQMVQQQGGGDGGGLGGRMATPEGQSLSRSAPGTEAFKQDFAKWEALKQDAASALDRYEASLAQRLAGEEAAERVTAPLRDQVPDRYSESVIRYYQSLSGRPESR